MGDLSGYFFNLSLSSYQGVIPRENFLQKHFITPLSHTLCDVKNFFQLDFNNPAVNIFFTPTKIFSHSRFING